ncbi:rRNA maturation RNase YbeY [Hazenella sp. IB182357]|uniref:Endoribonuclease YbeY n=1 Tax=Polycladospora coralii TaxID=2771432 RepID=A0A926N7V8_9BACL|nr:rRNA maturation RNase YbeY [Polycladospora coralii]MBD1371168.1 rRNA maturation RNase YbeY [Polycladospora coralii]
MALQIAMEYETEWNENERDAIDWMKKALAQAAVTEQLPPSEVVVTLVDNERIQQLNREYRNIDRPTDVLSFPLWEPNEDWVLNEEEERVPLGDIIISIDKAREQAEAYRHSFNRELGFLAVHGFLHLLGYDHETEEEEHEMIRKQEEILNHIQLSR